MFWTILVLLVVLWIVGMATSHRMGGMIHGLPAVAVVLVVVRLASGMMQTSLEPGAGIGAGAEAEARGESPVAGIRP